MVQARGAAPGVEPTFGQETNPPRPYSQSLVQRGLLNLRRTAYFVVAEAFEACVRVASAVLWGGPSGAFHGAVWRRPLLTLWGLRQITTRLCRPHSSRHCSRRAPVPRTCFSLCAAADAQDATAQQAICNITIVQKKRGWLQTPTRWYCERHNGKRRRDKRHKTRCTTDSVAATAMALATGAPNDHPTHEAESVCGVRQDFAGKVFQSIFATNSSLSRFVAKRNK